MDNLTRYDRLSNYVVSPGAILEDNLTSLGLSIDDFSKKTELSIADINQILEGKKEITLDVAKKFEETLSYSTQFWLRLEELYKYQLSKQDARKWINNFPIKCMMKLGWFKRDKDNLNLVENVLNFFGVKSQKEWESLWKTSYPVIFRESNRVKKNSYALSAWLRKGELSSLSFKCAPYDSEKFEAALQNIRKLTFESPKIFIPKLKSICADAGVAVVFIPELPNIATYGSTRRLENKILIQLSLRYKSNDHLWFSFFHEAGHVLLHKKDDICLSGYDVFDIEKEDEANNFARNILIPQNLFSQFLANFKHTLKEIKDFAQKINIAPGIVVGRLQHDKILSKDVGNSLKQYFTLKK